MRRWVTKPKSLENRSKNGKSPILEEVRRKGAGQGTGRGEESGEKSSTFERLEA